MPRALILRLEVVNELVRNCQRRVELYQHQHQRLPDPQIIKRIINGQLSNSTHRMTDHAKRSLYYGAIKQRLMPLITHNTQTTTPSLF